MIKYVSDKYEGDGVVKLKSDLDICKICDISYVLKVDFLEYMKESYEYVINIYRKVIDDSEKFVCVRCYKVYNIVDDFIFYVFNYRLKKKFVCDYCGNIFNIKFNFNIYV